MGDRQHAALARAMALPCWAAPQGARLLGGGKTNHNVLIEDAGRHYVVRLGHDIPEHGVMRFNELAISRAAHAAGLAPAVHYAAPGVMVLEYLDASPLEPADVRAHLAPLAALLRQMHGEVPQHLRGPILTFWVFHVIRDYGHTLAARHSPHLPLLPGLLAQAVGLEAMVGPVTLTLGHNDLLPANILTDGTRFWLIDWEYGGFNSPLFDLGGLASNAGFSAEEERALLTHYFGTPPAPALWRSYQAMKCASLLRETLWSMVSELTSAIAFDYATYTADNLAAYRAAHQDLQSL